MVELVGVRRRHRGAGEVLAGVDLRVEPGSPVVVLGANGSGKSTLLRIAAGCARPSRGRVRDRAPVVGFLPAPFPATSRLTVRAYLRHLAAVHGRHDAGRSAESVLDDLGFAGDRDGPVAACSTGNAQKVGLAQALGTGAGLLVLDEPWTALDDDAARALHRRLARAAATAAVLVADHGGRGAALPHAVVHRLVGGRLRAASTDAGVERGVHVVVRVPDVATAARLPPTRHLTRDGATVTAEIDPDTADAWLAAALAAGCSVREVRRGDGEP